VASKGKGDSNKPDKSLALPSHQQIQTRTDSQADGLSLAAMMVRSGPLPPPEDLAEYERVLPGSADRIIKMA
jgi:uncharacterized membrane protein